MRNLIYSFVVIFLIVFLLDGCALSEVFTKDYSAMVKQKNKQISEMDMQRELVKRQFIKDETSALIYLYGSKKGLLIANKALTDENIKFIYENKKFRAYIEDEILQRYIDEVNQMQKKK